MLTTWAHSPSHDITVTLIMLLDLCDIKQQLKDRHIRDATVSKILIKRTVSFFNCVVKFLSDILQPKS